MREKLENRLRLLRCVALLACVLATCVSAAAQSSDLNFPTPVVTNEIEGRIAPRDLGDPRLTSHFYTFGGTQGDLVLTVESVNLDGAVDLFMLAGLRPLTQFTLYATGGALNVTKTVFLRKEETLVLRVRARTPNDAEGTYRLRLSGTFQPSTNVAAAPPQPEETAENLQTRRTPGKGRRVNAVGARIEEPEPEPAATETAAAEEKKPEAAAETATTPRAPASRTRPPRRSTRTPPRRETARRTTTPAPEATSEPTKPETSEPTPAESAATEAPTGTTESPSRARTPARRNTRSNRTRNTTRRTTNEPAKESAAKEGTPEESAPAAPQLAPARLIIETRDGAKVEHEMGSVNRVTVVNQLIVVMLKNGRVERYPLTNVLRMAIEP